MSEWGNLLETRNWRLETREKASFKVEEYEFVESFVVRKQRENKGDHRETN